MMGHAGRLTAAASIALGLCVGLMATDTAQAQDAGKVKDLYEQGVKALEQGKYEDALGKFKAVFQEDPNQSQVLDLIRSTETKHFLSMLQKGGDYELAAKRLLELGHRSIMERSRDADRIRGLVTTAVREGDLQKRREASRTLMAEHGSYAVPEVVRYLGSNDTDERVRAIMVLEDIGVEAVLPLIEVLNSPDARVRENVVVTLRRILDPRAYPLLEWIASDKDQPGSVRRAAGHALEAYKAYTGSAASSIEDALLEVARAYYQKQPDVLRDLGGSYALWSWSEGGLVYEDCPKMMYHLRLAEKACGLAVKKDAGSEKARSMLSIVLAAQKVTLANASDEFKASPAGMKEAGRLALADAAISSGGIDMLNRALLMSLEWQDSSVARAILEMMPTFGTTVPLDAKSGVVAALASPDQTVQWAAAMAAAQIAPKDHFPRCDLVVPLLADAVSLGSVRQVLIIEPATKTAVQLQTELNGAGMHAVVARNGAQGLIRAKQVNFDVVMVSSGLSDMLANQVVNEIRRDVRTANVPVLVLAAESASDAQAKMFGDSISGVVSLPASAK
ncbi:MAG: HEAT repeat domain-containing protein, partial [Planctomycetota bacterium]